MLFSFLFSLCSFASLPYENIKRNNTFLHKRAVAVVSWWMKASLTCVGDRKPKYVQSKSKFIERDCWWSEEKYVKIYQLQVISDLSIICCFLNLVWNRATFLRILISPIDRTRLSFWSLHSIPLPYKPLEIVRWDFCIRRALQSEKEYLLNWCRL